MKLCCVGYRPWALEIYDHLDNRGYEILRINSKKEYNEEAIIDFNPDYIFFYGWSWIIRSEILNNYKCIMLHPSPLPKYRGGSPIQNQIINGEKNSAVTLFMMDDGIDTGDIIAQESFSLEGNLSQILNKISQIGKRLTLQMLESGYKLTKQNHDNASYYSRRKPEQSEITVEEILSQDCLYLYNKVRMLQDPYPNAFIRTADGKKLLIKVAEIQ